MFLHDQVVCLELAKKLKELNVGQASFFNWVKSDFTHGFYLTVPELPVLKDSRSTSIYDSGCGCCADYQKVEEVYSAYTVAELGKLLPENIETKTYKEDGIKFTSKKYYLVYFKYKNEINYFAENKGGIGLNLKYSIFQDPLEWILSDSEANSRALMLIYLIENKLIKAEDLKL